MTADAVFAGSGDAAGGGSIAFAPSSAFVAGETVFAWVSCQDTATCTGVSDPTNGSWTDTGLSVQDATNTQRVQLFVKANVASGSPTVTAVFSAGSAFTAMALVRGRGVSTTLPAGTSWRTGQVQNATGANGLTSGNATPEAGGSAWLVVGLSMSTGSPTGSAPTAGTSPVFTSLGTAWTYGTGSDFIRLEWLRVTSGSPVAAVFTETANVQHINAVAILTEAVSSGTTFDVSVSDSIDLFGYQLYLISN